MNRHMHKYRDIVNEIQLKSATKFVEAQIHCVSIRFMLSVKLKECIKPFNIKE